LNPITSLQLTQSKVNEKKLLLFWGTRRTKQKVLRLHITMDIPVLYTHLMGPVLKQPYKKQSFISTTESKSPFRVHLFQYGDCLYTYASNHLNRHPVKDKIGNDSKSQIETVELNCKECADTHEWELLFQTSHRLGPNISITYMQTK
jgi:hypothetical protein